MAAEVARFFQDLRGALHLTPAQTAQALATRVDIVAALEAGQIGALPPWPETCRIVRTYAGLVGLDPRPVLYSLEQLYTAMPRAAPDARGSRHRLVPNRTRPAAPPVEMPAGGKGRSAMDVARGVRQALNDRAGRPGMALFTVTMAIAVILLVTTQTAVLEAAVSQLPPSVARFVRGAQNYMIVRLAPVRDGLRWIDVPDPRTRRSDKLQSTAQSD